MDNKNEKSGCHWWEVWCKAKTKLAKRKARKEK